jgi:hypothetical protein
MDRSARVLDSVFVKNIFIFPRNKYLVQSSMEYYKPCVSKHKYFLLKCLFFGKVSRYICAHFLYF